MTTLLTFIVIGLATGSTYAIAAMGLVLTFKTSGIFNFAHGAVAALGAGVFYELHIRHGLSWPVALPLALVICAVGLGLVLERLGRILATRSAASQIVASVGLLMILQGCLALRLGTAPLEFPAFLPTRSVRIAGVFIGLDQLIIFFLGLAILAGLTLFFRRSRTGLAMRAVVRDPELLDITGIRPTNVRRVSWLLGTCFACLSGILLASSVGFNVAILTLLVVQAFGAAAIGSFTSLPLTYLGGLVVGVATALVQRYTSGIDALSGLAASLPFLILFVALVVTPRTKLATVTLGSVRTVAAQVKIHTGAALVKECAALAALIGVLLLVPSFAGARLPVYSAGLVYVIIFLSLAVLVRLSGQVSLAVLTFAAIGGSTFSHLTHGAHLPWLVGLLLAGLVAVPVGALIAIPAIRLPGVYLAVASLGFAVLMQQLIYPTSLMFGAQDRMPTPRPQLWGLDSDTGYYYVLLCFALAACILVIAVQRSRWGRLLRALADSPTALVTHGLDVNLTRLLVFCLSTFLAAIAGALYGPITGGITGGAASPFTALNALPVLAIFFVSGRDLVFTSFVGAAFFILPVYTRSDTLTNYYPVLFGVLVIVAAMRKPVEFPSNAVVTHPRTTRTGRGPARARWQRYQQAPVEPTHRSVATNRALEPQLDQRGLV